jgi:hypothetical protein
MAHTTVIDDGSIQTSLKTDASDDGLVVVHDRKQDVAPIIKSVVDDQMFVAPRFANRGNSPEYRKRMRIPTLLYYKWRREAIEHGITPDQGDRAWQKFLGTKMKSPENRVFAFTTPDS